MRAKNKKTFELSSIKKYKQKEHMLWLIPLGCFALSIMGVGEKAIGELRANPSIVTAVGILLFILFLTLLLSVFPFFVGKVTLGIGLKTTIENCTITSMQDFEYYRDKLTGLSPATISILTDLEIEQKKDVAASILQYENLGLLVKEADDTYRVTEKYYCCRDLNESDRYLIEQLEKGDFNWENDTQWQQLVMDEAVAEGYIARKTPLWSTLQKKNPIPQKDSWKMKFVKKSWRLVQILLGIVWIFWAMNAYPRMEKYNQFLDVSGGSDLMNVMFQPDMMFSGVEIFGLLVFGIFILAYKPWEKSTIHPSNKKAIWVIVIWLCLSMMGLPTIMAFLMYFDPKIENINMAEHMNYLLSQPNMMLGFVVSIIWMIYTAYLVSHLFAVRRILAIYRKNIKFVERTEYGNLMAECIYGMKNFIHDYSNLSEADKRQVVLWEDYLVYAVVLEENEQIVNEISKARREILC